MSPNSSPRPHSVRNTSWYAFILVFTIWCGAVHAEKQALEKSTQDIQSLKILTIGNSFADSVFGDLKRIVKSAPDCKIVMGRANLGGHSLQQHWEKVEKSEEDPTYKPYNRGKQNLKEMLQKERWDIVTLQQVSSRSFKPESYEPYFGNLYAYVQKYAPQAEIVIQMTWSYRPDHHAFPEWGVSDPADMYQKLYSAYTDIAARYHCRLIPSGMAVHLARQQQTTAFALDERELASFDYPQKPDEPKGSFIGRYFWKKDKEGTQRLHTDKIHLNPRGRYLQACVWFATLFDRPASDVTYVPDWMAPEEGQFLRVVAQQAVDTIKQEQASLAAKVDR